MENKENIPPEEILKGYSDKLINWELIKERFTIYRNISLNFIMARIWPFLKRCWNGLKYFGKDIWKNKKDVNIIFAIVWLGTAFIFIVQAYKIYPQVSLTLNPYVYGIPTGFAVGGADVGATVDGLVESYDNNVDILQNTIRDSAGLSFRLNVLSCLLATIGFVTQIVQYMKEKRNKNQADWNNEK